MSNPIKEAEATLQIAERNEERMEQLEKAAYSIVKDIKTFNRNDLVRKIAEASTIEEKLESMAQIEKRDTYNLLRVISSIMTFNHQMRTAVTAEVQEIITKLERQEQKFKEARQLIKSMNLNNVLRDKNPYAAGFFITLDTELKDILRLLKRTEEHVQQLEEQKAA